MGISAEWGRASDTTVEAAHRGAHPFNSADPVEADAALVFDPNSGGGLVVDESNSPHRILDQTQAAFLFAIAQNDDAKDPSAKTALRESADAANVPAVVEVYPADHGWTVIDSPAYDAAAANRAFAAILSLYDAL